MDATHLGNRPKKRWNPPMTEPMKLEWRKDQVPAELTELRTHLDKLPLTVREKLIPLCERVSHYTRLQGKLVRVAQDAVDQLNLDIKYLLFDLEATRRERNELRTLLDEIEEENGEGE
jgi:hypothetical protein